MLLAIDQGTTGTTCLVIDEGGAVRGRAYREFTQHFPRPGWVEHDPEEIWRVTREVAHEAADDARTGLGRFAGVGIVNQRETIVLWDRETGQPLHRALVWQDGRTAADCRRMKEDGIEPEIRRRTGLVVDPYFSATKLRWLLHNVDGAMDAARAGKLAAGTIDTWLIWKLTDGALHLTDHTNACRTLLYNIERRGWDDDLLDAFDVPAGVLPEIRVSSERYGETAEEAFGARLPIGGIAGDQQAALFGQGCWEPGLAKNTYGTGAFLLLHTGEERIESTTGLLTSIACGPRGEPQLCLEGAIFVAGAAVQWLRDSLGIIESAADTEALARSLDSNEGVYLVPAFTGLGAPHWETDARAMLVGMTRGTGRAHLARAALEAMAYSTRDVAIAMEEDSGIRMSELRIDGGASENDWLAQFQADVLGLAVRRPAVVETTAIGAAGLAGLALGIWSTSDEFRAHVADDTRFQPDVDADRRAEWISGWERALASARTWARHE